jgi:hypothetical protein
MFLFHGSPGSRLFAPNPVTTEEAGIRLITSRSSGTGKSHLLIGLGTAAAESGFRVRYTLAAKLVYELVEAADDKSSRRPSPVTAVLISFVSMCLVTWNSTSVALSYFSRFDRAGGNEFGGHSFK